MSSKADELVERLRSRVSGMRDLVDDQEGGDSVVLVQRQKFNRTVGDLSEAASTITALQERVRELEGALRPFTELSDIFAAAGASKIGGPDLGKALNAARTTLNGGTDGR